MEKIYLITFRPEYLYENVSWMHFLFSLSCNPILFFSVQAHCTRFVKILLSPTHTYIYMRDRKERAKKNNDTHIHTREREKKKKWDERNESAYKHTRKMLKLRAQRAYIYYVWMAKAVSSCFTIPWNIGIIFFFASSLESERESLLVKCLWTQWLFSLFFFF